MVDSWRPNHDRVQAVTVVEHFCRKRVSAALAHQGIRCVLAPNNCTERNDPCVGLNLAALMSEEGLIPDKIIHIKCIDGIIANKQNNDYNQTMAMVHGLPRYAAEIHGFNIIINCFNVKLKRNN